MSSNSSPANRREQLRRCYGFDFPEDLFAFYDFARSLRPLEPLRALEELLGIVLVGPFEVLAGRFDGLTPRYSYWLHWRYHDDPPEFFTILAGQEGLHWGYYLDDPTTRSSSCVASYYLHEDFELSCEGDSLFAAVRLHLEHAQAQLEEDTQFLNSDVDVSAIEELNNGSFPFSVGSVGVNQLAHLRERLCAFAHQEQEPIGLEYTERYSGQTSRTQRIVAKTLEGMGIVVPPQMYRPLVCSDRQLWSLLRKQKNPVELVEQARQALFEGFPGSALKLGKDLWALTGRQRMIYSTDLLLEAYTELKRDLLVRVLQTHLANRDLPFVDILESERASNSHEEDI